MANPVSRAVTSRMYSPAVDPRPTLIAQAVTVIRRIIGVPDYDRYVAHVRERHPTETPMSRAEFERRWQEDRYNRPGTRCC